MMLLNSLDRYFVQSSVRTLANLSRPNRIGATVNAIRSSRKACRAAVVESVMLGWRAVALFPYERDEAFVIFPTGGAALQVRGHAGHRAALDVLVEVLEALLAADLGAAGSEQAHVSPPIAARSLRRASCNVL